jgi:hypothetical protein
MKAYLPRARITAQFLYLVSNPTPMPASTKGATMPMERTGSPRDSGSRPTSQRKRLSKKPAFSFWSPLQK